MGCRGLSISNCKINLVGVTQLRTLAENYTKMELGPLQKLWIASLREHPERQTMFSLGRRHTEDGKPYEACCLGELHLCYHRMNHKKLPFNFDGIIVDGRDELGLGNSWALYGLRSNEGRLLESVLVNGRRFGFLAEMN